MQLTSNNACRVTNGYTRKVSLKEPLDRADSSMEFAKEVGFIPSRSFVANKSTDAACGLTHRGVLLTNGFHCRSNQCSRIITAVLPVRCREAIVMKRRCDNSFAD